MSMGWEALGKCALMMQPAIVSGLMFENSPSLTRAIFDGSWEAMAVALVLALATSISVAVIVLRDLLRVADTTPRWMPHLVTIMASCMGATAVLSVNGNVNSFVLAIGYVLDTLFLFKAAHLYQLDVLRDNNV